MLHLARRLLGRWSSRDFLRGRSKCAGAVHTRHTHGCKGRYKRLSTLYGLRDGRRHSGNRLGAGLGLKLGGGLFGLRIPRQHALSTMSRAEYELEVYGHPNITNPYRYCLHDHPTLDLVRANPGLGLHVVMLLPRVSRLAWEGANVSLVRASVGADHTAIPSAWLAVVRTLWQSLHVVHQQKQHEHDKKQRCSEACPHSPVSNAHTTDEIRTTGPATSSTAAAARLRKTPIRCAVASLEAMGRSVRMHTPMQRNASATAHCCVEEDSLPKGEKGKSVFIYLTTLSLSRTVHVRLACLRQSDDVPAELLHSLADLYAQHNEGRRVHRHEIVRHGSTSPPSSSLAFAVVPLDTDCATTKTNIPRTDRMTAWSSHAGASASHSFASMLHSNRTHSDNNHALCRSGTTYRNRMASVSDEALVWRPNTARPLFATSVSSMRANALNNRLHHLAHQHDQRAAACKMESSTALCGVQDCVRLLRRQHVHALCVRQRLGTHVILRAGARRADAVLRSKDAQQHDTEEQDDDDEDGRRRQKQAVAEEQKHVCHESLTKPSAATASVRSRGSRAVERLVRWHFARDDPRAHASDLVAHDARVLSVILLIDASAETRRGGVGQPSSSAGQRVPKCDSRECITTRSDRCVSAEKSRVDAASSAMPRPGRSLLPDRFDVELVRMGFHTVPYTSLQQTMQELYFWHRDGAVPPVSPKMPARGRKSTLTESTQQQCVHARTAGCA